MKIDLKIKKALEDRGYSVDDIRDFFLKEIDDLIIDKQNNNITIKIRLKDWDNDD